MTSVETNNNQNKSFEEFDLANLTPPSLIRELYSDDEIAVEYDSLDSELEYESDTSDLCESENTVYELYLQKILFEEEHRRELLLEVFGDNFDDSDYVD